MDNRVATIPRYRLTHPGNVGIYGKTQSGKTTLICELIRNANLMVRDKNDVPITYRSIWIFHGVDSQPLYEDLQRDVDLVTFFKGFPTKPIEEVITVEKRPALIFIDDQEELLRDGGENRLKNLVNRDCHHLDMLVVMSFQSLFPRGNEAVNIQRQFDVYIFMTFPGSDNVLLKLQKILGARKLSVLIVEVWRKWANRRGGYMLLDLHLDRLEVHKSILAWTQIFPNDQSSEYLPRVLVRK